MNTADPANPWSRLLTTPPTTTVESILRYPAHSHDYRRHLADYEATRVEPGADPRAGWARRARQHPLIDRDLLDSDYDGLVLFERGSKTSPLPTSIVLQFRRRDFRYVPHDVARWRDPAHRAELLRRAREHAAIRPGVYR
jgi:hypothetical protein